MDSLVSIIIPTYNSSANLTICLDSFLHSTYKNFEIIVNDDKRTNDDTSEIIAAFAKKGLDITYLKENILMAQARKKGAQYAKGDILLHLDSDMKVSADLLAECVDSVGNEFDALVINEESYGTTFWAKCKWLEKKCYKGVEQIESLRCIKREVYEKIGGHDERMVFSEDKDFDLRVRKARYRVGRAKNIIYHNEGNLSLLKTLRKKMGYSGTANIFAEKYPEEFRWQSNLLNRYRIYFNNPKYLFSHPFLYSGMIFMKTCEFGFGGVGYLLYMVREQKNGAYEKKIASSEELPKVSFLIPTYNAEKYLRQCLNSIFEQDYPNEKYEIIVAEGGSSDSTREILKEYNVSVVENHARGSEDGKFIAFEHSTGQVIVLMDSDNVIASKDWLMSLVQPLLREPDIIGVESNYLIATDFTSINVYANLLVIVDPLARMLASRPYKITKKADYLVKNFRRGSAPVSGANGFLWRRNVIEKYNDRKTKKIAEVNLLAEIATAGEVAYANVPAKGIYHYYCNSLGDYSNKRRKIARKFLGRKKNKQRTWVDSRNKIYFLLCVVYLCTFIGTAIEGSYMAVKNKRIEWLWHPFISILTIDIYTYHFFRQVLE